jgi:hypothetical protein
MAANAWDLPAALEALADLVRTLPGQFDVMIGAPESMPSTVTAYCTIGAVDVIARSAEVYTCRADLVVTLGYMVKNAEQAAELKLALAINEVDRRILRNRLDATITGNGVSVTPRLNDTVGTIGEPRAIAAPAEYAIYTGQEYRIHPRAVRIEQDETI